MVTSRRALMAIAAGLAVSLGLTGCADEIADAQASARAGLQLLWAQTAETINNIPLNYGTPTRAELLSSGVPALAPRPGTRTAALGSGALALTTRLTRGNHSFTVDLFLLADGSAGGGDLMKQRSAYACIRVTVTRQSYRLAPQELPCRRDLPLLRDRDTTQRVRLREVPRQSSTPQRPNLGPELGDADT